MPYPTAQRPLGDLRRFLGELPGLPRRYRELQRQFDELATIDWRHPVWLGLTGLIALFERFGPDRPPQDAWMRSRSADSGSRIDNFMGRRLRRPSPTRVADTRSRTAARVARAVVRARAAVDTLHALDGTLPDQPLLCRVAMQDGWLCRQPAPEPARVAFLTAERIYLAQLVPGKELALAKKLLTEIPTRDSLDGAVAAPPDMPLEVLDFDQLDSDAATRAVVAVSLVDAPLQFARHLHRQTWSAGGGPWLGIGDAWPYEVVTICQMVIDGYGHGLVTAELFRRLDALAELEAELADQLDEPATTGSTYRWRHVEPIGVASTELTERVRFNAAAYAFANTLTRLYGDPDRPRDARFSPTFMVPVAPARSDNDPQRRGNRILCGLMSMRMDSGQPESFEDFRHRLRAMITAVNRGEDLLVRFMQSITRAPAPAWIQRAYLSGHARPSRLLPPSEILAGRGLLSAMRFEPGTLGDEPLLAVSPPALDIARHDRRGALGLTLMHQDDFISVTACGTGLAAEHTGAARALDIWLDELARVSKRDPTA
ncbi:MAG: hypothetical protein AAGC55_05470 [Myxococcota bacterium]